MLLIGQLSDPHIRLKGQFAYDVVNTAAQLEKAVRFIETRLPNLDALMITGDLVDAGNEEEYAHFLELVAPLKTLLLPIPGNHDRRETFAAAFADQLAFPAHGHLSYVRDVGRIRLVMLDSTEPGAPYGRVCPERLSWLESTLSAAPMTPAVLALHHPPFKTGIAHMDIQNCQDGDALATLLLRHPQVLAVVAGHVHRTVISSFAGRPATIAPSCAHAVSFALGPEAPPSFHQEPPGLHVHAWAADPCLPFGQIVTHAVPIGTFSGPHPFFDEAGNLIQ